MMLLVNETLYIYIYINNIFFDINVQISSNLKDITVDFAAFLESATADVRNNNIILFYHKTYCISQISSKASASLIQCKSST